MTIITSGNLYKAGAQLIINQHIKKETGKDSLTFIKEEINKNLIKDQKTIQAASFNEEVCKEIEKTINQTIQNTLNTLEKDCEKIADLVDEKLSLDT